MRNQQAGGVVSFIIVAVALTGLLVGGLYLSKTQGRAARENDTSAPQVTAPAKDDKKTEEPVKEEEKPAPDPAPAAQQPSTQNQSATPQTSSTQTSRPSQNRVAATGPSDTLPATGPGETMATVIALSALAFTTYRFALARRNLRSAALNR